MMEGPARGLRGRALGLRPSSGPPPQSCGPSARLSRGKDLNHQSHLSGKGPEPGKWDGAPSGEAQLTASDLATLLSLQGGSFKPLSDIASIRLSVCVPRHSESSGQVHPSEDSPPPPATLSSRSREASGPSQFTV